MIDAIYLKDEIYKIIGLCMEVHKILGKGHSEVVYKDALEYEFRMNQIPFEREKEYLIRYKDIILPRKYNADFVIFDEIIFEVKAISQLTILHDQHHWPIDIPGNDIPNNNTK